MDVACIPNVNLEVALSSRVSLNASVFGSWSIYGMKAKTYGVMPEMRVWLNGTPFNRWFVGVGALAAHYDTEFSQCYVGNALGAGLTFGYDFHISKHFTIDVHAGLAGCYYKHRRSYKGDILPDPKEYDVSGVTLLPYQIGVSFVYVIR